MRNTDSEKVVERKLTELVKRKGGMSVKMLCDQYSGLPDRLCLLPNGRIFFAELKTTGKRPTKIQLLTHERLRALGFAVEVIDSVGQLNDIEDIIDNG